MSANCLERLEEYINVPPEKYFPQQADQNNFQNYSSANVDVESERDIESGIRLNNAKSNSTSKSKLICCNPKSMLDRFLEDNETVIPSPENRGVGPDWPHVGCIEFKSIYLKYATSSDYVLRYQISIISMIF